MKSFSFVPPAAFTFLSLLVSSALGCSADASTEESRIREATEVVSAPDASVALAMVREGDSLYVARAGRVDRIDARTGVVSEVAGAEWATCPRVSGRPWLPTMLDYGYPNLTVHGTTLFLVDSSCGVWSYDILTTQKRMLVDPSVETKAKRAKSEGVFPQGATWNGKTGADWTSAWGMAVAVDGERLLGCFTTRGDAPSYSDRIELWALSTDGTPLEMLTTVTPAGNYQYCTQVVPDATSILFATNDAVRRWDRASGTTSDVATGFRHGPSGLAQDDRHVFVIGDQNEITKISRADGSNTVLRPVAASGQEPPRNLLTLDGDHVYFHEGRTLMRMNKDGSNLLEVAAGTEGDWVVPMTLGIGERHVYFERITKKHTQTTNDRGSVEYGATMLGTLLRAPR